MNNPQNYFHLITNRCDNEGDFPEGPVEVKETRDKKGVMGKMDAIGEEVFGDYDDDLLEMGYKQDAPIPRLLSKLPANYLTPEK